MKKNYLFIFLMILTLVVMCLVAYVGKKEQSTYYETNTLSVTEHIHTLNRSYNILTDEETGVQYIVVIAGHGVSIYPRLDNDGDLYFPYAFEEENQ